MVMFLTFLRRLASRCVVPLVSVFAALAVLFGSAAAAGAAPDEGQWDPTLPKLLSAGAPGDPLAIANASLQATAQATQVTMDLGRKFLSTIGLGGAAPAAGVAPGRVRGPQAIEYVIRRGASQMGTPYSWGGGKPNGPSTGIDSGAGTVGYDCSGFTQFSYAGVGVLIPKYSGDQYNTGRKVPLAQGKRGDLLFWGPGGSQHVAIYLGNGQMLESSGSAGKVTVSPLRKAGLQPYVARIIES
ncbi:NlpC/P60 family peptidoglycan endopeptidase RipB [Mycolicibacterium sp. F2034L]|uniref:NlpC/P60 family peptidoglycan endopeptidase RipB n=1 Tax=Mycolicibacterium sp. F2034L TaxID=2926422 RepID=UPI0035A9351C